MNVERSREAQQDRSLGELFSELTRETGQLVRQEVQLAKTEMTSKAKEAGKDAGMVAAAAVIGHIALLALVAGVIFALAELVPLWGASLLVAALLGIGAYALYKAGITRLRKVDPVPQTTVQTLKEDKAWASRQFTS